MRAHMVGCARARIFLLEEALVQYRLKVDDDFQYSRNLYYYYTYIIVSHFTYITRVYFIGRNIYGIMIYVRILSKRMEKSN